MRGYLALGVRPHINLFGVRYTNMVLASSAQLIGQALRVYINADDLRCVRAFLADGSELGVLDAQGAWRVLPHNLTLRREILKGKNSRSSGHMAAENPIDAYVQTKVAAANRSRRAASDAARTLRLLANAPTAKTPTGPLGPDASPVTAAAKVAEATGEVAGTAPDKTGSSAQAWYRDGTGLLTRGSTGGTQRYWSQEEGMSLHIQRPVDPSLHPARHR
ncbi:hypothetical protein ACFFYR_40315 [Paraburkholderia dipogonis]|uniref:hypothetical protein n=1 Tax=Paraburkholderia dipogonis TaxID=1211383 RepID=UPI0035EDB1DC